MLPPQRHRPPRASPSPPSSPPLPSGVKYDPSTGIYGMDVYVSLCRRGARVAKRKHANARVGSSHLVKKEDAMAFFKTKFEGIITK